MKGIRHHKVDRKKKDKARRMAVKDNYYRMKIIRKAPPQAEKKVVVRQELVKDPKTGKAEYKNVYEVKDVENKALNKKLKNTLYIPHAPPPKEFKYLRPVKAHHISNAKKYPDPYAKYGNLEGYKKNRLLNIAKEKYDLDDKISKGLDKDDVIKFIRRQYKGKDISEFLPTKLKLQKLEPLRPRPIKYKPGPADKPWEGELEYGAGGKGWKQTGDLTESAFEKMNKRFIASGIAPFGEYRKMDKGVYDRFLVGTADPDEIMGELIAHLNLPSDEKLKLLRLTPKQAEKLYKKVYKQSQKKDFESEIRFPKFKEQPNGGHFSKKPVFLDPAGKPHILGTAKMPTPFNQFEAFDHKTLYGETPLEAHERFQEDVKNYATKLLMKPNKITKTINALSKALKEAEDVIFVKLQNTITTELNSNPKLSVKSILDDISNGTIPLS